MIWALRFGFATCDFNLRRIDAVDSVEVRGQLANQFTAFTDNDTWCKDRDLGFRTMSIPP